VINAPQSSTAFEQFVRSSSRSELLGLALTVNLLLWLGIVQAAQALL
jgi:hypothetical protein